MLASEDFLRFWIDSKTLKNLTLWINYAPKTLAHGIMSSTQFFVGFVA
jgi:hypothetical protein